MKRILSLATISFLLFSCGGNQQTEAQIGQYTTIEVEKVYNAGSVVKGEIVNAKIEIKNTGDYPLVIADIKPACNCTFSVYDKEPIEPVETTIVKANLDNEATEKVIVNKPITISANTRPSKTTVTIQANVID